MRIYTTLNRIKANEPCRQGWNKLLTFLNKTRADEGPLDLLTILESNGIQDCLWAFRCADDNESIYRHIAADFAESVLHFFEGGYPNDNRPRLAIQAARDFADGKISAAAMDAARDARAAGDAAMDAAGAAAGAAEAAWAAAWAAGAAGAATRAATRAAWAAGAAEAAARDAGAAEAAARDAELQKQHSILIKWLQ